MAVLPKILQGTGFPGASWTTARSCGPWRPGDSNSSVSNATTPAIPVLLRKLLLWNPNDNQGIRYVLGPTLLRAGRRRQSMKALAGNPPPRTRPCATNSGWRSSRTRSTQSARRDHAAPCRDREPVHRRASDGHPVPRTDASMARKQPPRATKARTTMRSTWSKRWEENGEATDFLRWLHTHPRVMAERAAALAPVEELLWEQDVPRRHALIREAERGMRRNRRRPVQGDCRPPGTARTRDRLSLAALAGRGVRKHAGRSGRCIDGLDEARLPATTTAPTLLRSAAPCACYRTRGSTTSRGGSSHGWSQPWSPPLPSLPRSCGCSRSSGCSSPDARIPNAPSRRMDVGDPDRGTVCRLATANRDDGTRPPQGKWLRDSASDVVQCRPHDRP